MQPLQRHPEYGPIVFGALWVGVLLVLSAVGGWRQLAEEYRAAVPFAGRRWWFRSAELRWAVHYGGCLTVGVNAEGLSLAVLFPFRIGHPPLFIPWRDVSATERTRWLFFSVVELRFRRVPSVPVRLDRDLARRIETAARSAWPTSASALERPARIT